MKDENRDTWRNMHDQADRAWNSWLYIYKWWPGALNYIYIYKYIYDIKKLYYKWHGGRCIMHGVVESKYFYKVMSQYCKSIFYIFDRFNHHIGIHISSACSKIPSLFIYFHMWLVTVRSTCKVFYLMRNNLAFPPKQAFRC